MPSAPSNDQIADRIRRIEGGLVLEPLLRSAPIETRTLAERMALLNVPGVCVAVVQAGALTWVRGYGVREAGTSDPVTEHTLFQACSISKPVTALAVLRLMQEGRLDLDEDVNAYLRSWRVPANGLWQPRLTLRHLLSHTGGTTVHGFPGYRRDAPAPTLLQVLDGGGPANTPPIRINALPGAQYRYSGGGTTIVQQVLMDVTHMPFPALMRALVLDPLGMGDSTYEQPLPPHRWSDAATAHDLDGVPVTGLWHVYPEIAAAGLWTTPADLSRVILEVCAVRAGKPGRLLTPASVDALLTPTADGPVGIGFFVAHEGRDVWFAHGGDNHGFKCGLLANAETGDGAVIMTNGDMGLSLRYEILGSIAREYAWPIGAKPEVFGNLWPRRQTGEVPSDALATFAGAYALRADYHLRVVARDDGALTLQPPGQSAFPLIPMTAAAFYAEAVDAEVTFERDDAGRVAALVLRQNDTNLRAPRMAPKEARRER